MEIQKTQKQPKNTAVDNWWQPGLLLFARVSSWIVIPVIAAMFLGQWLEQRYDWQPWGYFATVGVAFVISMIGLIREVITEMRRLDREEQTDQPDNL